MAGAIVMITNEMAQTIGNRKVDKKARRQDKQARDVDKRRAIKLAIKIEQFGLDSLSQSRVASSNGTVT